MSKVMIVIFENMDYGQVNELPFFKKLATEGALFTNFHGETHPSQPNYIALVSGSQNGVSTNDKVDLDAPSIADLLESEGKTWKVYAESYPGDCFSGQSFGTYVRRHNPFISFKNIQNNSVRCARIVNASALTSDVEQDTMPDYSFYVPDINNCGHDTSPAFAEAWYSKTFGPLITDSRFMKGMLLVTTFDESGPLEPTNHIYTSFFGSGVRAGSVSSTRYDHYNVLRTIEGGFGLGTLSSQDGSATAIADIWQ